MDATLEGHLHRRCGGRYTQATETVTVRLSGMTAKVDRELFRCDKCGDVQHTVEQREAAEREAILTMRHEHALLTGKEIRAFRESVALSTEQLGALLHGLPRGIVEGWEKGRYLQSPTVDAMIRSLADVEERERRAARAGITLPPLPGADGATAAAVPASVPAPAPEQTPADDTSLAADAVGAVLAAGLADALATISAGEGESPGDTSSGDASPEA
ncbi:MAG: hypothetical protein MUF21_06700 [Gemmatimonadaceae bacterium]|nr:hypothetical protein [Gemmatimonadaceae bacterium]